MDSLKVIAEPGFFDLIVIPWTLRILTAAAIWFIGKWIAGRITRMFRMVLTRAKVDTLLVHFLGNIIHAILLAVVVLAGLDHLGVPTTSMLAVFGAAGLAVGLALRDSLANFASGIMLILFRPFKVGDFIEAGGVSGVPEEIRIFSTVIRTPDNRVIIVPNGNIANDRIINFNALPTRRIDLVINVSYADDLLHAKRVLGRVMHEDPRILAEPAPVVTVAELAEHCVAINVRPWVRTEDFWPVRADLLERIRLAFDTEALTVPFPQREVVMRQG